MSLDLARKVSMILLLWEFIPWFQMVLPDSFSRKSTKLAEEVRIPHTEAQATNVGNQRIKIEDLDEVT